MASPLQSELGWRHLYPSEGYHLSRVQGKKVEELPSGSVHMEIGMACSSEEKVNKEWGSTMFPKLCCVMALTQDARRTWHAAGTAETASHLW